MAILLTDQEQHVLLRPQGDLLSLKDAQVPAGAFAMRPLSRAHVQQLATSDPQGWPPILVTRCTAGYIVVDGYHRWEAAKRKALDRMAATCQAYPSENAVVEAAFQANLLHGIRANVQTKGDYAYWLHVTFEDLTQAEIARRALMTQGAVSKAIALRDQQAKALLEQHTGTPADAAQEYQQSIRETCQRLTKGVMRFVQEVEGLDDVVLMHLFQEGVTTSEERAKLVRVGRLLCQESSPRETPGPLRLRQFASKPTSGTKLQ